MKIGLIADTHMPGSLRSLWPQAIEAFRGVDCILHAGDLHTLEIVDELSQLAPVYVAKGNGDDGIHDHRLQDVWMLNLGDVRVAMIHRFPSPERKSVDELGRYMDRHFGHRDTDVIVYGHTHLEGIHQVGSWLCVNPGSPTLPRNQSLRLGTIGLLDIGPGSVSARILQLTESGLSDHNEVAPLKLAVSANGR